jgi:hypothetical protein
MKNGDVEKKKNKMDNKETKISIGSSANFVSKNKQKINSVP